MAQCFKFVDLDKRQTLGDWGEFAEWFFTWDPYLLVDILSFQEIPEGNLLQSLLHEGQTVYLNLNATSAFADFPAEMMDHIFDRLDDLNDLASLGLTCRFMSEMARKHLNARLVELYTQSVWLGDRIICVGDGLDADNVPYGVLTPREREELQKAISAKEDTNDDEERISLYNWNYTKREIPEVSRFLVGLLRHLDDADDRYSRSLVCSRLPEDRKFAWEKPTYTRPDASLVLRNLTTHEYVREDALIEELMPQMPPESQVQFISLGHVLVAHISWSSNPSMSTPYHRNLHRGKWAGHRFDITTIDALPVLSKDKDGEEIPWKDVSKEAVELMADIWNYEYL